MRKNNFFFFFFNKEVSFIILNLIILEVTS